MSPAERLTRLRLPRPTPLEWLLLVAGLGLVVHYRWLFDDAFIYYRYVDNLLFLDSGLVYNRGEYVEGFSSPLYCLLLITLRALHLSYPDIVLGLGCVCFALFGYGLVVLNRRMTPPGPILNLPLALMALHYSVTSWFTGGLETPLEQVLAVATALFFVNPSSLPLTVALAFGPLVRPEITLALGVAGLFAWWRTRSFPWRLALLTALANGAWLLFRITYYADLLPNTFYLKDDTQPGLGLRYLWDLAGPYQLVPITLLCAGALAVAARGRHSAAELGLAPRAGMLAGALAVSAYVVRIGGGAIHYDYLSFAFPLFVCASAGLPELVLSRWGLPRRPRLEAAAVLCLALLVLSFYPRQLSSHPLFGSYTHGMVGVVNDAGFHRGHATLGFAANRRAVTIARLEQLAPALAEHGYGSASTVGWCRTGWVHMGQRVVHRFGLTDAVLARMDVREFRPGHKRQLRPLAHQILEMQREYGVGPGLYRQAVESGQAPTWVRRNLASLERIEQKIYNRHAFFENLALAFSFPPRIQIVPGDDGWEMLFRPPRRRQGAPP